MLTGAFEPYSTDVRYYYYPNGRVENSKFTAKQNKAAVNRLLKRTAIDDDPPPFAQGW